MISNLIDNESVTAAGRFLRGCSQAVIVTHMSPDGDAMGSALAVRHYLEQLGKKAVVVIPNNYPAFLAWMPGAQEVLNYEQNKDAANEAMEKADLVVCTDFNTPKRIGILGEKLLSLRCCKVMIDHHLYPDKFADTIISFPSMPSSCELVYRLIWQLHEGKMPDLPVEFHTCIYTGMMTDTGNFSFNSNYPEMYEIVGNLVRAGVDKDAVYNSVFNSYKADRMRLLGYCLYRKMEIFPEHHAAFFCLNRKELYKFNFSGGDAEGLVNLPLQIKGVHYSCFMREDKVYESEQHLANGSKTKIKISMRSQGNHPVNTFCADIFHGGGHKNASGGEYYGPLEEAVNLFMQNYKKYFN